VIDNDLSEGISCPKIVCVGIYLNKRPLRPPHVESLTSLVPIGYQRRGHPAQAVWFRVWLKCNTKEALSHVVVESVMVSGATAKDIRVISIGPRCAGR
jgi:hypothetical protein